MLKRSDGFPARRLVTALAIVWATGDRSRGSRQSTGSAPSATPVAAAAAALQPRHRHRRRKRPASSATTPAPPATSLKARRCTRTLHGKAQNARTPAAKTNQSCETCHGPGQAHVDTGDKTKIKRFTAMSPRDVNATCLTLPHQGLARELRGRHARRAQRLVRDLPQRAQPEVRARAAEDGDRRRRPARPATSRRR